MPSSNIEFSKEKLTEEEIIKIIKASEKIGIKKIRFTGGEPLVRKDLVKIIKETNSLEGIEDICLTTNGILLLEKLEELKENGLTKVNISLDTLNPLKYKKITRGGDINLVLKAIDKCLNLGIKVKLNVVIIKGLNDDEIIDLINLTKEKDIDVRFIELMPIGEGNKFTGISNEEIKD
ncbi:MAG: radical SAM protein, partial [Clostridium sp.]